MAPALPSDEFVSIVGAGAMGNGIAQVAARAAQSRLLPATTPDDLADNGLTSDSEVSRIRCRPWCWPGARRP